MANPVNITTGARRQILADVKKLQRKHGASPAMDRLMVAASFMNTGVAVTPMANRRKWTPDIILTLMGASSDRRDFRQKFPSAYQSAASRGELPALYKEAKLPQAPTPTAYL